MRPSIHLHLPALRWSAAVGLILITGLAGRSLGDRVASAAGDDDQPADQFAAAPPVGFSVAGGTADFNNDGNWDCSDVDALVQEIVSGTDNLLYDLDGDGLVNHMDIEIWLDLAGDENLGAGKSYLPGDANLDGFVDAIDFVEWNTNKFTSNAAWCFGDFNADGVVDGLDYFIWNANKFTSS